MKNENRNWTTLTSMSAFLIGVILFWTIGKAWLNLESASVFLSGLIGVAVAVLTVGIWKILRSRHDES